GRAGSAGSVGELIRSSAPPDPPVPCPEVSDRDRNIKSGQQGCRVQGLDPHHPCGSLTDVMKTSEHRYCDGLSSLSASLDSRACPSSSWGQGSARRRSEPAARWPNLTAASAAASLDRLPPQSARFVSQ